MKLKCSDKMNRSFTHLLTYVFTYKFSRAFQTLILGSSFLDSIIR